jgi:kynurenine formamidase
VGTVGADREIEAMIARVSNWGRWGSEDQIGTVNHLTPERRRRGAALARTGRAFSLSLPFGAIGLQPPGDRRLDPHHVMLQTGTDLLAGVQPGQVDGWGYADDMVTMALQGATHWDGLGHAFYDYKMYNNRPASEVHAGGADHNAVDQWRDRIAGRGVLLDLPRLLGVASLDLGHRITQAEMEAALERQGVSAGPGDILLLRTGNLGRARRHGGWDRYTYTDEPGIGLDLLPWLHERQIAGIASDTWAMEVIPSGTSIWLPVHAVAIVHMGLLMGENFVLDDLAEDCAADGVYEFFFCAPPLPFAKAVGGPVNPLVIK